jgi:hypothetical protein
MTPEQREQLRIKKWEVNANISRPQKSKRLSEAMNVVESEFTFMSEKESEELRKTMQNGISRSTEKELRNRREAIIAAIEFLKTASQPLFLLGREYELSGAIRLEIKIDEKQLSRILESQGESLRLLTSSGSGICIITQEAQPDSPYYLNQWYAP